MGETKKVYRLALLAMMIALCHVGRIAFQFLPNVQPVTTIILILTLVMGTKDGIIVAVASILLSNLTMGMGVWTLSQIVSYIVLVFLTGSIRKFQKHPWFFALFSVFTALSGYLYGLIISLIQAPFFGIQNFTIYYMMGIPFDTMHAIGNLVFYLILAPVLIPIIKRAINKGER